MCYFGQMTTIGVRDLRQNASEILRDVEAGQAVTVTVQGRPVAELTPIRAATWTTWAHVRAVFDSPNDLTWEAERRMSAPDDLASPWER
jgi:prevent-host-death family protein